MNDGFETPDSGQDLDSTDHNTSLEGQASSAVEAGVVDATALASVADGEESAPEDESPHTDISAQAKEWVDKRIPRWKTGTGIMCRAKNSKMDLDAVQRYVDELVASGKIPATGKKAPRNKAPKDNKEGGASSRPAPLPLPTAEIQKEVVEVAISEIHMNAQIRKDDLNEANVLRIMEGFDSTDPVDLFKRPEGELELANGYHRVESARRLGRETIRAYIHEGTMCDALMFAYRTNDRNGIPLTKADRMNALIMIRKTPEGKELTGEQLADQLNVSRQTIQTYLAEIRDGKALDAKKSKPVDKTDLQKKAVLTLKRIEERHGLDVFRAFVDALDADKRRELRSMLSEEDSESQKGGEK